MDGKLSKQLICFDFQLHCYPGIKQKNKISAIAVGYQASGGFDMNRLGYPFTRIRH